MIFIGGGVITLLISPSKEVTKMAKVIKQVMSRGDDEIEGTVMKYTGARTVGKMAKSKTARNIGGWAFMIGFLIALIVGIFAGINAIDNRAPDANVSSLMIGILVLLGLIVGVVNVSSSETLLFLVCAMAIMITPSGFSALGNIGMGAIAAFLGALTSMLAVFVAPAAVIVALKGIYSAAREA